MPISPNLIAIGLPPAQAEVLGYSSLTPVTASGLTQGTAYGLRSYVTQVEVTTSAGNTGIRLPDDADVQQNYFVLNSSLVSAAIYPPVGGAIDGQTTNLPFSVGTNVTAIFTRIDRTRWVSSDNFSSPSGVVDSVGVTTANGFAGSSSGGTTPSLTLTTTQSGTIYGNGTALTGLAGTTSTVLHGNASGAPSFGKVDLTAEVSGTLPVANGGTGLASVGTSGYLLGASGASLAYVPFLQAGTGAVNRTWNSKAAERVAIEDFRQPADANWSVTAARAITYLQSTAPGYGGILHFGPITYNMGTKLTIGPSSSLLGGHNIILEGEGLQSTLLQFDNTLVNQDGIAWVAYGGNAGISDMTIDGASGVGVHWNSAGTHGGTSYQSRIFMRNVVVQNCGSDGISSLQTYIQQFDNCESRLNGGIGWNWQGVHTETSFRACQASQNGTYGWSLNGMVYSSLRSCGSDGNSLHGYLIQNSRGLQLISCGAEQNVQNGIYVISSTGASSGLPVQGVKGLIVSGFFGVQNCTGLPGTAGNIMAVITANSQPTDILLTGASDILNAPGDLSVVLNGGSGTIVLRHDVCAFAGALSGVNSYVFTNMTMQGRSVLTSLSGSQALVSGVLTTLAIDTLTSNTLGATISSNTIIIPAGVSRVRVTAGAYFDNNATGSRLVGIAKNGANPAGCAFQTVPGGGNTPVSAVSAIIDVTVGDAISAQVLQTTVGALNVLNNGATFLGVEAVG